MGGETGWNLNSSQAFFVMVSHHEVKATKGMLGYPKVSEIR